MNLGSNASVPEARLRRADVLIAVLLFVLAALAYGRLALRLSQGLYFTYDNLAFDFDPSRMLSLLTGSPPDGLGFKHPLMLLARPLGLAGMALGLPAPAAAGVLMAGVGATSLALVFVFLRSVGAGRAEALALSALFAVTGTQMLTAMIAETYGFAGLSIVLVWLIAQLRLLAPARFRITRYAVAVMAAGITITNALQPCIAELLVDLRCFGWRSLIRRLVVFGVVCAVVFALLAMVVWPMEILAALRDPVAALKAVWWLQTKGPTTGPLKLLQTYFGYSFVLPNDSILPLPEGIRMIDFRDWSFPGHAEAVVAAWLIFAAVGTVAGLAHPGFRPLAVAILATLLLNLAFHLDFQFRGSIFIYAAHTHFLVFALAAGLAPWMAGRPRARAAYTAVVLALTIAVGTVNIPVATNFATRFDRPDVQCAPPCSDGGS